MNEERKKARELAPDGRWVLLELIEGKTSPIPERFFFQPCVPPAAGR